MNSRPESQTPKRAGWYKRQFARIMAAASQSEKETLDARKRALLGDLHGRVLEIGPGTGPNLVYYAPDVQWFGVEPNPAMFPYLQAEAKRLNRAIDLREGQADHLDAPDQSFDAVVATLVLCSVPDQTRALQEIRRVLKPGGRFVFLEHVAAPPGTRLRGIQKFIRPAWKVFADGCNIDRDTGAAIQRAGFSSVQIEPFQMDVPIVGPHISGVAVK